MPRVHFAPPFFFLLPAIYSPFYPSNQFLLLSDFSTLFNKRGKGGGEFHHGARRRWQFWIGAWWGHWLLWKKTSIAVVFFSFLNLWKVINFSLPVFAMSLGIFRSGSVRAFYITTHITTYITMRFLKSEKWWKTPLIYKVTQMVYAPPIFCVSVQPSYE